MFSTESISPIYPVFLLTVATVTVATLHNMAFILHT